MRYYNFALILFVLLGLLFSCSKKERSQESVAQPETTDGITLEELSYDINGVTHRSYAAYDAQAGTSLPVVIVLPEWWGMTDFIKEKVHAFAKLGYYAVAVDYYGEAKEVEDPAEASKLSSHFYNIPIDARRMFDAVKNKIIISPNADFNKMAIVGYCFGGAQALNMARLSDDFKGVVSVHGNLQTGIRAKNNKVQYLVLHGNDDSFVPESEVEGFKKEMDSAGANLQFIGYEGAKHAFSNPKADEIAKKYNLDIAHNPQAAKSSWDRTVQFLQKVLR